MENWLIIGIILILWAVFDLFTGTVWLHKEIKRDEEAIFYWLVWIIWAGIAVTVTLGAL